MDGRKSVIGLLGKHIENSLSPFIHQHFIRYYSLNYCYHSFQINEDRLKKALLGAKALGIQGLNITIPFKEKAMEYMDLIDPSAKMIGAINTMARRDKKIYGYNTDWKGFIIPLVRERKIVLSQRKAVILGAGGAARAVIFALEKEGCTVISMINRNQQHALETKKNFEMHFSNCAIKIFSYNQKDIQRELNEADLLINTTPLGSWYVPNQSPLPKEIEFPSQVIVYDLIYYPDKTPLLKQAEIKGNQVINGREMLVYQAAESFYLWTGIQPEQEIIIHILKEMDKKR